MPSNFLNGLETTTLRVGTTTTAGKVLTADVNGEATWQNKSGKGFVAHGSNASVARPVGWDSIEWTGSVEPVNAINGDTWINTT